jgi:outer membrane protein assembly factor BamB
LASIIFPPAGIVMLWLRPLRGSFLRRAAGVAGKLALTLCLAILALSYSVRFGLIHMELSGVGYKPIFSLRDPARDLEALEKDRAAQQMRASAEAPSPSIPAENVQPVSIPDTRPLWTDFRGPNRAGIYAEGPILTNWPEGGLKPLWRQPIGGGYASFTVSGKTAFTIEQRRGREVVAAYDVHTGREIWTYGWDALFSESMGGDGPRATPVVDGEMVFALGAAGQLHALHAGSGKVIWSKDILADNGAKNITWGMANSPLIVDGKVIVTPGGANGRSVVAYDRASGARVWESLSDPATYTAPMEVTLAGQRQILVVTALRVAGLSIDDGRLLWGFSRRAPNGISAAQPIVTDSNHVFVSAAYDFGSTLLAISPSETGFAAHAVWESRQMKSRFNSSVLHKGYIYGFDESIFTCIDARTGERQWKGGRYGYGQALLAGDHIIVLTESGELALLRATPKALEEVARFQAIEGKTWNHPAIADGILLVRNAREMAAFAIAPGNQE